MATKMATILEFPGKPVRANSSSDKCSAEDMGEVIIFPGVRIEHWEEPQSKARGRRKKRAAAVNRDTLDLLD